jgi:hypothetical protein
MIIPLQRDVDSQIDFSRTKSVVRLLLSYFGSVGPFFEREFWPLKDFMDFMD